MEQTAKTNAGEFSVSEIARAVKRTVEDAYDYVRVRGEISGFRGQHGSGHAYFALKDEKARLEAVIWKGVYNRLGVKPEEGLEVIATGKITTYPGSSKYQIVIEMLEPAGMGALMALLEERKRKLAAEGLFEQARKQSLPFLPKVIGVITSPTGAVIRDIMHRLDDRFQTHVLLWPVRVQGESCAKEVTTAIRGFNAFDGSNGLVKPDVLIVARGGGSLEDLWGFNDELVTRATAESSIPIISAVGHETDWTLIDFASDKRAPTPTAAAEMAVPVRADLLATLDDLDQRNKGAVRRYMHHLKHAITGLARALPSLSSLLALPRQRVDEANGRLPRAAVNCLFAHRTRLQAASARLSIKTLLLGVEWAKRRLSDQTAKAANALGARANGAKNRLIASSSRFSPALVVTRTEAHKRDLARFQDRANRVMLSAQERRKMALARVADLLTLVSYQSVLSRGFALLRDDEQRAVRSVEVISEGVDYTVQLCDGTVTMITAPKGANRRVSKASKTQDGKKDATQGSLF